MSRVCIPKKVSSSKNLVYESCVWLECENCAQPVIFPRGKYLFLKLMEALLIQPIVILVSLKLLGHPMAGMVTKSKSIQPVWITQNSSFKSS